MQCNRVYSNLVSPGKKKEDDKPTKCADIKDRKHCRKSKLLCSWCNGKLAPSLCFEEVRGCRGDRLFSSCACMQ